MSTPLNKRLERLSKAQEIARCQRFLSLSCLRETSPRQEYWQELEDLELQCREISLKLRSLLKVETGFFKF